MWSKEFYLFFFVVLKMFSLHEIWVLTLDTLFTFFFQFGIIDCFSQRPYFACLFSSISSGASVFLCIPAVYRVFMFLCIFCFIFWGVYTQLHFMELHPAKYPCSSCEEAEKITSPKNFHLLTKGNVSWRAVRRWEATCLLVLLLEHWFN